MKYYYFSLFSNGQKPFLLSYTFLTRIFLQIPPTSHWTWRKSINWFTCCNRISFPTINISTFFPAKTFFARTRHRKSLLIKWKVHSPFFPNQKILSSHSDNYFSNNKKTYISHFYCTYLCAVQVAGCGFPENSSKNRAGGRKAIASRLSFFNLDPQREWHLLISKPSLPEVELSLIFGELSFLHHQCDFLKLFGKLAREFCLISVEVSISCEKYLRVGMWRMYVKDGVCCEYGKQCQQRILEGFKKTYLI